MPVRKEIGDPGADFYFAPDSEYVHGNHGYLARTVLAIVKVVVGLALLMPGLASLLMFWLCEGAPAPQAPGAKPSGLFARYGEPVVGLALFVLLMVLWARKAPRGPPQAVRTNVVTGAALESIGSSADGMLR